MRSSKRLPMTLMVVLLSIDARARAIDMNDERRAVGRENDVRVDAQLTGGFFSPDSAIAVRYQIENLSAETVAVADRVCEASYDSDSRTITIRIGAEVPANGQLPRMVTIRPGEKKTFNTAAVPGMGGPAARRAVPRFVQITVSVLRDLAAFLPLIEQGTRAREPIALTDEQFGAWLDRRESIVLNAVPVTYRGAGGSRMPDASVGPAPK